MFFYSQQEQHLKRVTNSIDNKYKRLIGLKKNPTNNNKIFKILFSKN